MAAKTSIAKTITKLYYSSGSHSSHPKHLATLSPSSSFSSSSPDAASPAAESQSTISSQAAGRERSRLSRWLLFLPGAMTFGLGTWQIIRRQEKSTWNCHETKTQKEPEIADTQEIPMPQSTWNCQVNFAYRTVRLLMIGNWKIWGWILAVFAIKPLVPS